MQNKPKSFLNVHEIMVKICKKIYVLSEIILRNDESLFSKKVELEEQTKTELVSLNI